MSIAVLEASECYCALHRLDRGARAYRCLGLEWFYDLCDPLLVDPTHLQNRAVLQKTCQRTLLDRHDRDIILCYPSVLGGWCARIDVDRIYARRCVEIP